MELELGLKITQTRDDQSSTTNFQMAKDTSGPIFMSTETESKFILTSHMKGFEKEHIGIKINEDGTQIIIRMERPVREVVMSGWMVQKKGVEMRGFVRAFRIPNGVVLDQIKAKFNQQDSVLTIMMPKSAKGMIGGAGIEEVKQQDLLAKNVTDDNVKSNENEAKNNNSKLVFESLKINNDQPSKLVESSETKTRGRLQEVEDELLQEIEARTGSGRNSRSEDVLDKNNRGQDEAVNCENESFENGKLGDEESETDVDKDEHDSRNEETKKNKKWALTRNINLCRPCVIAGSSVIVTLVVLAIHWIRSKKRQS